MLRNIGYGVNVTTNNGGIIIPYSASLNPTDFIAIEISCKLFKGKGCFLVDNSQNGTTNSYYVYWDGATLNWYSTIGGAPRNFLGITSPALRLNDHNDIVIKYDGSTVMFLANGAFIAAFPCTGALGVNTGQLRLGQHWSAAYATNTVFSSIRFYHTNQYTMKSHRMRVFENKEDPALLGTCILNLVMVGSGTAVPDISGLGNHGTLASGSWTTDVLGKARPMRTSVTMRSSFSAITRPAIPDDEEILRTLYCKMYCDGDALSNLSDGGVVNYWPDRSGREATPSAVGSFRPTLYKTTLAQLLNGKPTVYFNGSQLLSSQLDITNQPFTVFIVGRTSGVPKVNQYFMDGSNFNTQVFYRSSGNIRIYAFSNVGPIVMPDATWSLLSARFNGASSFVALGATEVTGDCAGANGVGITLANSAGGTAGVGLDGSIALVVVAYGVYSAEQVAKVRNAIIKKFPNLTL